MSLFVIHQFLWVTRPRVLLTSIKSTLCSTTQIISKIHIIYLFTINIYIYILFHLPGPIFRDTLRLQVQYYHLLPSTWSLKVSRKMGTVQFMYTVLYLFLCVFWIRQVYCHEINCGSMGPLLQIHPLRHHLQSRCGLSEIVSRFGTFKGKHPNDLVRPLTSVFGRRSSFREPLPPVQRTAPPCEAPARPRGRFPGRSPGPWPAG